MNAFEAECNGQWEKLVEQDYPRLHLSAHLNGAKEYKKLTNLLTEGDEKIKWAEAREKKEETYAGYLNDPTYVWDYAEREQNYALAIRCMLIENSIHSLASNIPTELLAELAKAGIWSYARCLSIIRQKPESDDDNLSRKAESLMLITPELPPFLFQEVLSITHAIKDKHARVRALVTLALYLNDELKTETLQEALSVAHEIKDKYWRASAFATLAPHFNEKLKIQVLQEALAVTQKIEQEYDRAVALVGLAPYLTGEIQISVLQELLYISRYSALTTWKEIEFKGLKEHIISFTKFVSQENRKNGIEIVGILTPALIHFRGPEIVPELYRAIQDTARWCP